MKLELDLNDEMLSHGGFNEFDVKMIVGVALLNAGVTSTGKTAEILGLGYVEFYENIGKYEDLKFEMTIDDLRRDFENA
jgi:predicted HTH domain antitoxin